ncbi:hypothetical protein LAV73_08760 [Lysinibacillus xylanilyticus]|uniref:hypothetical protein n=1 Tax=Lysinibacillus xylanilyticus TaxID=582475 RepID=UPI002B24ECE1|nr:hypothetical protein [Lysinibacillus xylanilyticus]MEB2280086.1 hypothetical protein [Lysinibacillus xylanilyticus]
MEVLELNNSKGKLKLLFIALFFSFTAFMLSIGTAKAAPSVYKEGDILVTNDTQWGLGIFGHAGIVGRSADGNLYAVHIPGPNQPIQKITLAKWNSKYNKTEVWRHNNQTAAVQAGQKSMDFVRYYGSDTSYVAPYSLWSIAAYTYADKSETYCSKLVWQSYYYGSGLNLGWDPKGKGVISPYQLRGLQNMYKVAGSDSI